jgi:Caspase domain
MGTRHALLIGIPCCADEEAFAPIPEEVVRTDITRMTRSLSESGYQITVLGVRPYGDDLNWYQVGEPASRNRCLDEIAKAYTEVDPGGTLLIYFSGHGVRIDGADYLVPRDFGRPGPDGKPQANRLVPVNFGEEAARCQARLVACFIDACRNLPAENGAEPGSGGGGLPELPAGSFVLVRGCAPGEVCAWQQDNGSVFTRALAHALGRYQSQRTLREVLQATKDRLSEQDLAQRPNWAFSGSGAERQGEVLDTVICDGVLILDDWHTAVTETPLWALADDPEPIEALRAALGDLVSGYAKLVGQLRDHLARTQSLTDTWTDDGYPGRVLNALYLLLTPPGHARPALRPVEVATLIAAPFLREAVLALGLHDVADVEPRDLTRRFGTGLRCDLENVFANHEQLTRRASGLARVGSDDRDALAMWLVHRWLLEREDLWNRPKTCSLSIELTRALMPAAGPARTKEQARRLLSVIRCITTVLGPESERLAPQASDAVRVRPLGHLLAIAGILGADPRRMSAVLADHVGTHDPVQLSQLHETLAAEVVWQRRDRGLVLDAVCGHPAVHAALADLAQEAHEACAAVREAANSLPKDEKGLLAGVSDRCGEDLRPEVAAYDKPLLRFHLAGDRIRDLLMGSQLYGDDAAVAIREIYQNALDACRYRRMRLRCQFRTESQPGWQGRIVLREAIESGSGRRYIECQDNGVGMTESVLRHAFTAAGTRFVHSAEFRREQARWRQVDPAYRLYPNSQFGIGVFSYFMLADEVSVWTAATDESGLGVESRLYIHIPGPGGLLRLRRDEEMPEGIRGGGTIVRLYLSADLDEPADKILADYLVVSEYQVEVWRGDTLIRQWSPGIPQYPGPASPPPRRGADGVWWVPGPGIILSDGLVVGRRENASEPIPESPEHIFGRLINLTGPHLPRLSVDRTSMLDWDRSWVQAQVLASIPDLAGWPGFTWTWLWSLTGDDVPLAQAVFDQHSDRAIPIDAEHDPSIARIDAIGCYADDVQLLDKLHENSTIWPFATPWRLSLWRQVTDRIYEGLKDIAGPVDTSGFPLLTPADDDALLTLSDMVFFLGEPDDAPETVQLAIGQPELLYRLRRFVLAGLDLRLLRDADDGGDPRMLAVIAALSHLRRAVPLPVLLLRIAILLEKSLGDVADRLRIYAASHGQVLPGPGDGPDLIPTSDDLKIVSRDGDGIGPWNIRLTEWIVEPVAARMNVPAESIKDRIAAYARVGFVALSMRPPEPSATDDPTETAVHDVLRDLTGIPEPLTITRLAFRLQLSERAVYQMIAEAANRLGMPIELGPAESLPADVPTQADHDMVDRRQRGSGSLDWVIRDRRSFLADTPSAQAAAFYQRNAHLLHLPERITPADLVRLACALGTSVGHAESVVRELFAERLDLPGAQALPKPAASLRPTQSETQALLDTRGDQSIWQSPPAATVARLGAQSASRVGEVLAALAAYRPLGAQVPDVDKGLAEYQPDGYDHLALELATPPAGETGVSALQLVRIAGRYGWTVRHAFDRLNRFGALGVELEPSKEECPEIIVHWADLLLLSEHLDGYDPAPCGTVDAARISRAADAVRETPAQTRARLLRYADLFQLDCEELP